MPSEDLPPHGFNRLKHSWLHVPLSPYMVSGSATYEVTETAICNHGLVGKRGHGHMLVQRSELQGGAWDRLSNDYITGVASILVAIGVPPTWDGIGWQAVLTTYVSLALHVRHCIRGV